MPIASAGEVLERAAGFDVVGIDEVQFLDGTVVLHALEIADRGARVVVAGLDQDLRRLPFGPLPELPAHAEFVGKLHAVVPPLRRAGDDGAAPRRRPPGAVLGRDGRGRAA